MVSTQGYRSEGQPRGTGDNFPIRLPLNCLSEIRKALDNIDQNQMSHRYVSGVLQNEPSTSGHLIDPWIIERVFLLSMIDRCANVNLS